MADKSDSGELVLTSVKYRITFTEELLGTSPGNPDVMKTFIASKRPEGIDPAEVAALPQSADEEMRMAMTVFSRMESGAPCLWDYQIKGFFKDSCSALARNSHSYSSDLKAYKKIIDGLIFVAPRKIELHLPAGAEVGTCERPLRAQTAQGERVALANSETVPPGTWMECTVSFYDTGTGGLLRVIDEWFGYAKLKGFGQWRNSGKGRANVERVS